MEGFISSSDPRIQTTRKFPSAPETRTPNLSLTPKRKPPPAGNITGTSRDSGSALKNPIQDDRERVLGLIKMFRERCRELLRSNVETKRVDMKVFMALQKEKGAILKASKRSSRSIGAVPGVEIEDRFDYRAELVIAGLHRHLQNGIDWVDYRGKRVACCVVANEGGYDKMNDCNSLVYRGQGGGRDERDRSELKRKADHVMKGGNLAMKNSIEMGNEVRVVRGLKKGRSFKNVYVYDGLYEVVGLRKKIESEGNMVFEFEMRRKPGQAKINWRNY